MFIRRNNILQYNCITIYCNHFYFLFNLLIIIVKIINITIDIIKSIISHGGAI